MKLHFLTEPPVGPIIWLPPKASQFRLIELTDHFAYYTIESKNHMTHYYEKISVLHEMVANDYKTYRNPTLRTEVS